VRSSVVSIIPRGTPAEALLCNRQTSVLGAEVGVPLAHAVSFVDGKRAVSAAPRANRAGKRGVVRRPGAAYSRVRSPRSILSTRL
jgi:hypothetical protein